MQFFHYVTEYPSGKREQILSTEHMLYVWEAAEALGVDEPALEKELEDICRKKPKTFYVTFKGKYLRCYALADILEAAMRLKGCLPDGTGSGKEGAR